MRGLSSKAIDAIERLIDSKFDSISLKLLGLMPKQAKDKSIVFSASKNNLMSLFFQALGNRTPNQVEETTLKTIMRVANGYLDSLKDRTKAKVVHEVDSYVKNQRNRKEPIKTKKIGAMIDGEMDKAGKHIKLIANAETNKCINTGTALKISKIAGKRGQEDPTVFFIVTIDDVTGPEEFVLHLLPDRKTPRVWKLSEIGAEYHKVGDPNPKLPGLHPNCRCKLTYLAPGWGFDAKGRVKYIDRDHDEFEEQRKKYGLPR